MLDLSQWVSQLADKRGRRVIFLSHCLLNENTRYLGGACRAGAVEEIVQPCLDAGLGIVQMRCPEQIAWGGILKRRLLKFSGSKGFLIDRLGPLLRPLFIGYTRHVYRKLAKQVAGEIEDYVSSGFSVAGIVGVDGSPSCGVCRTINIPRSLEQAAGMSGNARVEDINQIVLNCLVEGQGIFVELLQSELARRKLNVRFMAHDLTAELRGELVPL